MKSFITCCFLALALLAKAQTTGYQVGDKTDDFKLKNVNNKYVSLADYKSAKGFIVIFTCNTCPVAQAYEERIKELDKKYASKGYPVIAINPNDPGTQPGDSFDKMQQRSKDKAYTFPYLLDPDHIVTKKFGANRTPHVFLLEKQGNTTVVQYIGAIDDDTENASDSKTTYVENAVNSLIEGKKPALTFTKAVGCTIKWKKEKA